MFLEAEGGDSVPPVYLRHAYEYRRKIDGELARILRMKELQVRAIGFLGTVVVGAMIGLFNLLSQLVYSDIKGE